jgi:DNA-binding transcriptional LysR family regulator
LARSSHDDRASSAKPRRRCVDRNDRVHALEDELGMPLFTRLARRLELTRAGQSLAQRVGRAVGDIARAVADLDEGSDERRLAVTMPPSLASRWFVPRLPRDVREDRCGRLQEKHKI